MTTNAIDAKRLLKTIRTQGADAAFEAKHGSKDKWFAVEGAKGVPKNQAEKEYRRLRDEAVAEQAEQMNETTRRYST